MSSFNPVHVGDEKVLDTETLLDIAGSLIVVFDRQGKIKRFNRACESMTGYSEQDVQNHCVWDFLLMPEERVAMQGIFRQLRGKQTTRYYESTWLGKAGESHVIAWSNTVLTNRLGQVEFIVSSGIEVTEQRRSRRQLEGQYRQSHLLVEITQKVRQSLDLQEILQTTVSEVQALLGCDHVFILQASLTAVAAPIRLAAEALTDDAQGPAQSIVRRPWPDNPLLRASYIAHYRQQSISVIDTMDGPGVAPEIVAVLEQLSVKSELTVPILISGQSGQSSQPDQAELSGDEAFWGLLVAHQCTQSRRWSPLEIDLMQQLANQIGVAINHAQLLEHLEDLVAERTAELTGTNQQMRREMNERIRTETALRRSEKQLRLITNALPALVAYIDVYHRYRFNNYAYETWYSIPYEQIKGRRVSDIVSLSVYQQMLPYLEQALSGEKVTYEAEMIKSSGEKLWASVSYIPDVQEGRVKGLFSLISDISDRKAAERMKDEFVSVVSHELRTPLTSVHGSLKLLSTGKMGELGPQGQELIEIALNNTERLTRLLNDVLDLERIGSGRFSLSLSVCSVADLLKSAVDSMQAMADDFGITLNIVTPMVRSAADLPRVESDLPISDLSVSDSSADEAMEAETVTAEALTVWADADQVIQALTNLLSNAIKFSPRGGTVWVHAKLHATSKPQSEPLSDTQSAAQSDMSGDKVEFLVKDAGRGIPSDKLETIFEKFQQVDTSDARERGGTGLGLAICREIIQQHQGRIWVKSVHGQGSAFYFTLPVPVDGN
ncbi:MAG: ATP-binding protein [Phormidesmis sp.]